MADKTEHPTGMSRGRIAPVTPLLADERQWQGVLETLTDGVALWDAFGRLRYANPAMRALCRQIDLRVGSSRLEDFVGRLTDDDGRPLVLDPQDLPHALCAGGLPNDGVVRFGTQADGIRWVHLHAAALRTGDDADLAGVVSMVTDITELKTRSETMARLAHFDPLTGLPNRLLLQDRMNQLLAQHRRLGRHLAVCY